MAWSGYHNSGHDCSCTRRTVVLAGGALAASALAGCLGSDRPDPVAVEAGAQCDVCGMVIANHPGPNGQLFLEDASPEGHDDPAVFDSLKKCLFPYTLEQERRDRTVAATYATDYSAVDYEVTTDEGATYISSHTAPGSFAPAADLHYVVESEVQGAMGPDFHPFSVAADATAFADAYGGRVLAFEEIGADLVGA